MQMGPVISVQMGPVISVQMGPVVSVQLVSRRPQPPHDGAWTVIARHRSGFNLGWALLGYWAGHALRVSARCDAPPLIACGCPPPLIAC